MSSVAWTVRGDHVLRAAPPHTRSTPESVRLVQAHIGYLFCTAHASTKLLAYLPPPPGLRTAGPDSARLHRTAVGSATPGGCYSGSSAAARLEEPVRTLSLESWGHKSQQTGPVVQVEWSPDCRALAVGFAQQGVVVWSPSGCRLMCSLRQPGLSAYPSLRPSATLGNMGSGALGHVGSGPLAIGRNIGDEPSFGAGGAPFIFSRSSTSALQPGSGVPLDGGVTALAWGPLGYQLMVAEAGGCSGLAELQFAHSLPGHHRVAHAGPHGGSAGEEVHVLQVCMCVRGGGGGAARAGLWVGSGGVTRGWQPPRNAYMRQLTWENTSRCCAPAAAAGPRPAAADPGSGRGVAVWRAMGQRHGRVNRQPGEAVYVPLAVREVAAVGQLCAPVCVLLGVLL